MNKSAINPMPAFFDRYIEIVDDINIFDAFEKYSPDQVYHNTSKMVELGDRVYEPGKWNVRDILQHVIDNERIMSYRALRFSRNDTTVLPGYDEQQLAANTNTVDQTVEQLMNEFRLVRASTIALFQGMSEAMLLRSGHAYKSDISALALGFVIIGHSIHHMRIITDRYFPLMG
jgi:hypothetical protein